jgi:competence protein ComEA
MEPGQRNVDAVRAAGGAARGADLDAVNLAAPVNDGSRLFIPMAPDSPAPAETLTHGATNASGESAERAPETARLGKLRDPAAGQIDINAAGPDELMRVPGVGATMAARIVEYRSVNGPFSRAEDLARVSGIGARKLAKMLPFVSVR